MSTKGLPAAFALSAVLTACAAPSPGSQVGRFSQIGFGPVSRPRSAPALRPSIVARDVPPPVLPVSLGQAQARVAAFLGRSGFALESRPEGGGELVLATRMGAPAALDGQATCTLQAMRRPTVSATELTVRLTPAASGVRVQASARFVEINTKIISGDLARETCRSRGVLEGAVEAAALGG